MIEEIEIRNFQNIRLLRHKVAGRIMTIVGESDHGKSAIIRAVKWVLFNEAPANFISWGESECSVRIRIDGHSIERKRGKTANSYIVDGMEYAAVRDGVPSQVERIMNVDAVNVQNQFDASFWVSSTAGERARMVNGIANLDIIDCAFKEINSNIRRNQSETTALNSIMEKKKAELETLLGVLPKLNAACNECTVLNGKAQEQARSFENLEIILRKAECISGKVAKGDVLMSKFGMWKKCLDSYSGIEARKTCLEKIIAECGILSSRGNPGRIGEKCRSLEKDFADFGNLGKLIASAEGYVRECETLGISIREGLKRIKRFKEDFERESGGRCPICGGKLNV